MRLARDIPKLYRGVGWGYNSGIMGNSGTYHHRRGYILGFTPQIVLSKECTNSLQRKESDARKERKGNKGGSEVPFPADRNLGWSYDNADA